MARLLDTAAAPSLNCDSDVTGMPPAQLNEARLIARKNCREKQDHRSLDLDLVLEDALSDPGRRGAMSAILMWQCTLRVTKTLLAASMGLRDCNFPLETR